jgi:hypothetical protein
MTEFKKKKEDQRYERGIQRERTKSERNKMRIKKKESRGTRGKDEEREGKMRGKNRGKQEKQDNTPCKPLLVVLLSIIECSRASFHLWEEVCMEMAAKPL